MNNVLGTPNDDMLSESLFGTIGDDNFYGYTGINWYNSSLGNDIYNGGPSTDLIFYSNGAEGITLNNTDLIHGEIDAFSVKKTDVSVDRIYDINNFHATSFDDMLYLNSQTTDYTFLEGGDDTVEIFGSGQITLLQNIDGSTNVTTESKLYFETTHSELELTTLADLSTQSGSTYLDPYAIYDGSKLLLKAWFISDDTVRLDKYLNDQTYSDVITSTNSSDLILTTFFNHQDVSIDDQVKIIGRVDFERNTISAEIYQQLRIEVSEENFLLTDYVQVNNINLGIYDSIAIDGWSGGDASQVIDTNFSDFALRINSGLGDDIITGGSANDRLSGEGGNDRLIGGAGNDALVGGSGDDILEGGLGDDTYTYNYLGSDTVTEFNDEGYDRLVIRNEGNGLGDLYFVGEQLIISSRLDPEQNYISIYNARNLEAITWLYDPEDPSVEYTLEGIVSSQEIPSGGEQLYVGTQGDDYIQTADESIYVEVYAGHGDDTIVLSESNTGSWVSGSAGADIIHGGSGNDQIHGDYLPLGEFDTLTWSDQIFGHGGDDRLFGNQGNDILDGGAGNDTLESGSGNDELQGGIGTNLLDGGADFDTAKFFLGTLNDIQIKIGEKENGFYHFSRDGVDIATAQFVFEDEETRLQISVDLPEGQSINTIREIEQLHFSWMFDTENWNATNFNVDYEAQTISVRPIDFFGTDGNDHLEGTSQNEIFYGLAGDDSIHSGGGDDIFYGGTGQDNYWIDPRLGNHIQIINEGGLDEIKLEDTEGRDSHRFYKLDDRLVFETKQGTQVEIFDQNDGQLGIYEVNWYRDDETLYPVTYHNPLVIKTQTNDINHANFIFSGTVGDDYLIFPQDLSEVRTDWPNWGEIYLDGGDDYAALPNSYSYYTYGGDGNDQIVAAIDGVGQWIEGQGGNDILYGGVGNDNLEGGFGDDTLDGGAGDDTVDGSDGDDLLTGGDGSDTFLFVDEFDHDAITDFDSDEDTLEFYASDGSALNISDLIETVNSDGNRVLSTADGLSSVTLEGTAGTISGGLAMSVVLQDGDVVTFGIFAGPSTDPDEDGIGSFDFTLSHDASNMQIDVGSLVFATGLSGVPNYDPDTGTLTAGAFTLNNVEDLDAPLLVFEATMLDTNAPTSIQIFDIVVDGVDLANTTEVFDFAALSITTTITDRSGNAMNSAEAYAYEASNGDQFFVRKVGDDDDSTVFEIVALPDANISAIDFELADNADLTDFIVSDALADWSVQSNSSTANTVTLSGFGAIDGSADITSGQATVLATFTSAASPDFVISEIAMNGVSQQDVSFGETVATSTTDNVTVFETASGSDVLIDAAMAIDSASDKAIGAFDALQALRLAVGLDKSDGTSEWHDYIAADINKDGRVGADDALNILKFAVGLTDGPSADWVFVDGDADHSGIDRSNTDYNEGILISDVMTDMSINMTGILVGDVDGSYIT